MFTDVGIWSTVQKNYAKILYNYRRYRMKYEFYVALNMLCARRNSYSSIEASFDISERMLNIAWGTKDSKDLLGGNRLIWI